MYQSMREIWHLQSGEMQMLQDVVRWLVKLLAIVDLGDATGDSGREMDLGPMARVGSDGVCADISVKRRYVCDGSPSRIKLSAVKRIGPG